MAETLSELVARISVDAAGLKGGLSDAEKQTEASSKKMAESVKKVGMAMAAAGAVITTAFGFMIKSAIESQSVRIAFEHLTSSVGQSSEEILKALKTASRGTVSEYNLMLAANRAMVLGVATNTNEFTALMEVARDRAKTMGITTTQAFNDIVLGIGRGSRLILDNLGIIINLEIANEEYAQSLGKTSSELSETEKKQALLNAVLEQGQASLDKTSQNTMTAKEMFEAFKSSIKDLSDGIGNNLLPIFQYMVLGIKDIVSNVTGWIKEHPELAKVITITTAAMGLLMGAIGTAIVVIPKLIGMWAAFHTVVNLSTASLIAHKIAIIAKTIALGIDTVATKASTIAHGIYSAILNADLIPQIKQIISLITIKIGLTWADIVATKGMILVLYAKAAALKVVTAAQWLWNAALLANPIGLVILAIMELVAIGIVLWQYWDSITHDLGVWFGQISGWAVGAFDRVKEAVMGAVQWVLNLWQGLLNLWNTLMSFMGIGRGGGGGGKERPISDLQREQDWPIWNPPEPNFPAFMQKGGIVTKPTLGVLGEAGAEAIIPLEEMPAGNITINFTQPVFFDREDTMNKFVDMIRKGIQRQDRLRFGGAYSG